MSIGVIFYVLFALLLKHLIIDFPVYSSYGSRDITTPHRPIWYIHIVLHGIATMFILYMMSFPFLVCVSLGMLDLISHYLIDSVSAFFGVKCRYNLEYSRRFSWIVNMDQFLHSVVYACLTFILVLV